MGRGPGNMNQNIISLAHVITLKLIQRVSDCAPAPLLRVKKRFHLFSSLLLQMLIAWWYCTRESRDQDWCPAEFPTCVILGRLLWLFGSLMCKTSRGINMTSNVLLSLKFYDCLMCQLPLLSFIFLPS